MPTLTRVPLSRLIADAERRRAPGLAPRRVVGGALLLAGVWQAVRMASRLRREHVASAARLRPTWTAIDAPDGGAPLRLHARVADDVPAQRRRPVVLVHGYGIGSGYFAPLAARLAGEWRVYAPDLPGHGASEHAARPLTVPELADALGRWMDAWRLRGAVIVGQSLGCQIAAELVVRRPELASALVLVAPTIDPAARSAGAQIGRAALTAPFEHPALDVLVTRDYLRAGPRVVVDEMRHMLAHDLAPLLPRIAVPVTVVRGARDRVVPQGWAEQVAALASAPSPVVVPGGGHAVHYDAADEVAAVVRAVAASASRAHARPARAAAPA